MCAERPSLRFTRHPESSNKFASNTMRSLNSQSVDINTAGYAEIRARAKADVGFFLVLCDFT